jgi:predicted O-linked N-acetylglucosamine transferase (SPINDLY family)
LHLENQKPELAVASYQSAISAGAEDAAIHSALGILLYRLSRKDEALTHLRIAEQLEPDSIVKAQYESGSRFLLVGDSLNAIANFELAITLRPDHLAAHSKLLFCLSFNPGHVPGYQQAAERFGATLREKAKNRPIAVRNPFTPGDRMLRVGFVSGDFKAHPVGFFLEGVLAAMDRQRIHCMAYSNTQNQDLHTERLKQQFAEWHEIQDLGDEAVDAMVREHRIDILVDLAGHTGDNRLPVFAGRPAPVQVSWLGYFASTGMAEMDFFLADPFSLPDNSTEFFAETICYLPDTRLCLTPPRVEQAIDVAPPPALVNGYVTFGCYQPLNKISPGVLAAWKAILDQVPRSRLRLQIPRVDVHAFRSELAHRLDVAGIDAHRITISPGMPWETYLASYSQVDFLLDTFPYPGGTTTAEALWMGVPTLTLMGDTLLSRQGASMMHCVKLDDWIASSSAGYVAKAVGFASDLPALAQLRKELRARALQSPLFDTPRFARHLADAFERMFQVAP